jgi:hypothetical protein
VGGEYGEDAKKKPYRMCGIELCVTRGDPVIHMILIVIDICTVNSLIGCIYETIDGNWKSAES